jgi:hypothetical protein
MTKDDLLSITLDQLLDAFKRTPECFELMDREIDPNMSLIGPTIKWSFKLDLDGMIIPDPNNAARTIIISYNDMGKQLSCHIFFREVNAANQAIMADAQATAKYAFPILSSSYRKFHKLRNKLIRRHRDKENDRFLRKLQSIFPTTFDNDIFGE